jgi:hypothetical protein
MHVWFVGTTCYNEFAAVNVVGHTTISLFPVQKQVKQQRNMVLTEDKLSNKDFPEKESLSAFEFTKAQNHSEQNVARKMRNEEEKEQNTSSRILHHTGYCILSTIVSFHFKK